MGRAQGRAGVPGEGGGGRVCERAGREKGGDCGRGRAAQRERRAHSEVVENDEFSADCYRSRHIHSLQCDLEQRAREAERQRTDTQSQLLHDREQLDRLQTALQNATSDLQK